MRQIKTTVDDQTHDDFVKWAAVNWPMVPLGVILRCWIIQHTTSNHGPTGSESLPLRDRGSMAVPSPSSPDPLLLIPQEKEKKGSKKKRGDRGSMAVPESKRIAGLCVDLFNELKHPANPYRKDTKSFDAMVRQIDGLLSDKYTEANILDVIRDRWARWKGGKMKQYVRPETLFSAKFADYLSHVGEPIEEQVPMFGRKLSAEEENAAAWERAANDPDYGKGWQR